MQTKEMLEMQHVTEQNPFLLTHTMEAVAGQPPPQKKLHREAKRKIEDKPDERLRSARRVLSAIFTTLPCPQTPEAPKRMVRPSATEPPLHDTFVTFALQQRFLTHRHPATMYLE